jgi:hypothetical protein
MMLLLRTQKAFQHNKHPMLDESVPPEGVGVGWIHSRKLVPSRIVQWSWLDGNNASE